MGKNYTKQEKIAIFEEFLSKVPHNEKGWLSTRGMGEGFLTDAVRAYAKQKGVTSRGVLDAMKLGLISIDDVSKTWKNTTARSSKSTLERLERLEIIVSELTGINFKN